MTLYDYLLLLRARWRWLVAVPAATMSAAALVLLFLPAQYEARAIVRVEATATSILLARLNSRNLAQRVGAVPGELEGTRGKDDTLIEVRARAGTPEEAVRIATDALRLVETATRRRYGLEMREHAARLRRVETDRQSTLARPRNLFKLIEAESLTHRIEVLRDQVPRLPFTEVIDPALAAERVTVLTARGLFLLVAVAALAAALGVFCVAWWDAEGAARLGLPLDREA